MRSKPLIMLIFMALLLAACGDTGSGDILTPQAVGTLPPTLTPVPSTPLPNYTNDLFGTTNLNATLTGGGSTRLKTLYDKWLPKFKTLSPNIQINYQPTNSGGGQAALLGTPVAGTFDFTPLSPVDFAAADFTYNSSQLAVISNRGEVIHIPMLVGAVVVAYHLDGFSGDLHLSGPTLAKIFLGQIKNWNSPEIAAENSVQLPAVPITVAIPRRSTSGSGTSETFSRYLALFSDDMRDKVGVGSQLNWPSFGQIEGVNGTDVARIVSERNGTLGYVDQEQAEARKLPYASIRNQTGRYVKPTQDSLTAAAQGTLIPDDFRTFPINAQGANVYPLAGFTWVMVWSDFSKMPNPSAEKAQALANFLWWSLHDGQKLENLPPNFAPLPALVIQRLEGLFVNSDNNKVLKFNGQPVLLRNK